MKLVACFIRHEAVLRASVNESSCLPTQTPSKMAGLWEIEADILGQIPKIRVNALQECRGVI